jgi:hypothetical protein
VTGTKAEIYLHHNLLEYGKRYYVTIDDGVLTTADDDFHGVTKADGWSFTTKESGPDPERRYLTVNADGSGDFTTVQGAMDWIPDFNTEPYTVYIHNGDYEELVYFRNKRRVTIEGESREGVSIHYPNNEVFNPHPDNVATNEQPGTFPSRRAAFTADNCSELTMRNLTISTTLRGQAEGLLLMGEKIFMENRKRNEPLVPVEELDQEIMSQIEPDMRYFGEFLERPLIEKLVEQIPHDRHMLPDRLLIHEPAAIYYCRGAYPPSATAARDTTRHSPVGVAAFFAVPPPSEESDTPSRFRPPEVLFLAAVLPEAGSTTSYSSEV